MSWSTGEAKDRLHGLDTGGGTCTHELATRVAVRIGLGTTHGWTTCVHAALLATNVGNVFGSRARILLKHDTLKLDAEVAPQCAATRRSEAELGSARITASRDNIAPGPFFARARAGWGELAAAYPGRFSAPAERITDRGQDHRSMRPPSEAIVYRPSVPGGDDRSATAERRREEIETGVVRQPGSTPPA